LKNQTLALTVPAQVSAVFLLIYKNDTNPISGALELQYKASAKQSGK
jgi:hypothetical protein